ncbi:GRP family sugar transporter [Enterococcus mundtii]|uniref:Multidrug DMT transporter permease n=1 Tax=Enterococcus mundtii TaxID=53346 RepID=A0A2S7RXL0_ENTMU|nr:GRP family sugar transporter [Enterococcus mundtii]PQF24782.1 multidrug DMT transporter permease [Enterococcus mundtii]
MSIHLLFLALIPALGWGMMPILSKIMGGKSEEQLIGTTIAALLFGLIFSLSQQVTYQTVSFIICFLSGVFWAVGQYFQFRALEKAEVSKAMPISVGTQLAFVTLVSGIFLLEWTSVFVAIMSIVALTVILVGILLVTKTSNGNGAVAKQVIVFLCISSGFLMLYVTITSYFDIHGPQVFLPQSIGMFVGGMIISMKKIRQLKLNAIARNIVTGCSWVIANTTLFAVSASLGVGITYSFSQMSLLVATYGSIILLREKKTSLEKRSVYLGTLVYVVGVVGMSLLK